MRFTGILFDINGTLVDILTDEGRDDIYRTISNYLRYHGVAVAADRLRDDYFVRLQAQKKESDEAFPEFDAVRLWQDFLAEHARPGVFTGATKLKRMAQLLAEMYRAASMFKLQLYPGVEEVLAGLAGQYRLAALSDAQRAWALPELRAVGLDRFFETVVVSGDLGYRKPDRRIFTLALEGMGCLPQEVLFVGNDMYRDVHGAQQLGMRTVYFASNQGRRRYKETEADYIIYQVKELPAAIAFLQDTQ
jgi:putative hydrolase of the HAD superfamily